MSEEARREPAQEFPYRVASPEFFFLLQRIDRLDEKLTAEIAAVRQEIRTTEMALRGEIAALRKEVSGTLRWVIGLVLTTLGLVLGVALKVWF